MMRRTDRLERLTAALGRDGIETAAVAGEAGNQNSLSWKGGGRNEGIRA